MQAMQEQRAPTGVADPTCEWSPIDYILASYDMRNLSNFYPAPASVEHAAHRLLELDPGASIVILTGFCVTETLIEGEMVPVCETDGPPGAVLAGETLRQLSYNVSYVADPVTAGILRACLKSVNGDGEGVHEFVSSHNEVERIAEAQRLIDQLKPQAMLAGELASRNWYDGIRRNMRGTDIDRWNPPVDEMLVQFRGTGLIVAVGDGGNEAGMGNLKDKIPLALDGKTVMASGVYSDIPITSWNSNLGLQAIAATAAVSYTHLTLPTILRV